MKHHFADMLDRSGGYWTMTPNQARWRCHFGDLADAPGDVSRLMITRDDRNWRKALDCQNLVELTLHEPSQEQLAALPDFPPLKALRISHARPASLAMLESQPALQELVLEYVSRVDDLAPVGALPCLTALHLENLRGVSDFSPSAPRGRCAISPSTARSTGISPSAASTFLRSWAIWNIWNSALAFAFPRRPFPWPRCWR